MQLNDLHLNSFAQKVATAFLIKHALVNFAGSDIVIPSESGTEKPG